MHTELISSAGWLLGPRLLLISLPMCSRRHVIVLTCSSHTSRPVN